MGGFIGSVSAVEYSTTAQIEGGFETDNNVRLVADDEDSVTGFHLSPRFTGKARTPTLNAQLSLDLDSYRFDDSNFDTDDQDLILRLKRQLQTSEIGVTGGWKRDSTLTSELEDTGRVTDSAVRREDASVAPYWQHVLDQRNDLRVDVNYHDVTYGADNFSDYEVISTTVAWLHELNERTGLQLQLYASNYEADSFLQAESDSYGLRGGFETALTERLQLNVLVGASRVETSYHSILANGSDERDTATFVDSSLNYSSERSRWSVHFSSDAMPSGDGLLSVNNRISTSWVYQLSQRLESTLRALYGENEALDDRINNKRNYANFEASMLYQLTQELDFIARYRHREQDYENRSGSADSDALFLTLHYSPDGVRWSR